MKTKININGEDVEITLTAEQIKDLKLGMKVTDRIKTFEDAERELALDINWKEYPLLSIDEIAYMKLKIITRALNEKWEPNWDNSNEYKYWAWFYMGSSGFRFGDSHCVSAYTYSLVGSRLCFKSRELAEYAAKQFTSIYKDFLTK